MTAGAQRGSGVRANQAIAAFDGAIVTPRLVLRPATLDDAAALYRLFNDWEVVRWLATPEWPHRLEHMQSFIARALTEQANGKLIYYAIELDGQVIGAFSWTAEKVGPHIGYWIGREFWSRGFMSEAAAAACDAIFALSDEPAIYSGVFEGNAASLRIQQRLGFIQIGTSVHYSIPRGYDLVHLDTKLTRTARRVALEKATP